MDDDISASVRALVAGRGGSRGGSGAAMEAGRWYADVD